MRIWKIVGLAGVVGVAGVTAGVVAHNRSTREYADVDPDELRSRLHDRLRQAEMATGATSDAG